MLMKSKKNEGLKKERLYNFAWLIYYECVHDPSLSLRKIVERLSTEPLFSIKFLAPTSLNTKFQFLKAGFCGLIVNVEKLLLRSIQFGYHSRTENYIAVVNEF